MSWMLPTAVGLALLAVAALLAGRAAGQEGVGGPGNSLARGILPPSPSLKGEGSDGNTGETPVPPGGGASGSSSRVDPAPMLGRLLFLTGIQSRLRWEMVRAGVMLWPSELAALSAGTAALGWALGRIALHQNLLGLALAGAGFMGPWLAVGARRAQRLSRLTEQLPPALTMLASSLRSGYSLMRGFQVLAEEMQPPIAEEIQRVLDETYVGYSLDQALTNLVERTHSADLKLVVTAIQIQSQVGGNLAEILDKTAALIRDRFQLASEVSALTAEGRMSTAVLVGMPIGLALIINILSPGYLNPMLVDPLGRAMLMAAGVMLTMGVLIIKKMLDVTI